MKIKYIELRNFSNIYTSFKSYKISIDFTKCKNRVILLTGPNGSGKTSILSCLHPFATNGNLDVRSENPLIIEGKDGYKKIIIEDNGSEYIIEHFYTPNKESHTVKSYINMNDVELNPNGNVTSFKEIIKSELDIEMDFLKLTRLGSNVTNFIDLKTTERKAYMGKILDEVDIYLKYFKKITNDMRQVKSIISHTVDKISKLAIHDIDEIEKYKNKLYGEIETLNGIISTLNGKISIVEYELSKYDSSLSINEMIITKKKELEKIYKLLNKHNDINIDDCKKLIITVDKELVESEASLNSYMSSRITLLSQLDKLIQESEEISKELAKMNESSDIKDTEYMISELKNIIETRSKENKLSDFNPTYSKDDMEELVIMLNKNMEILYSTYELGKEPIKKAISFISEKTDITRYVSDNTQKINRNKLQSLSEYVYNAMVKKFGNIKPLCDDSSNCKVMQFYNEIFDLATEVPDTVVEDETFVTYTKMAFQNINTVLKNIRDHKDTIEKLPDDVKNIFVLKTILDKIQALECIYDKDIIYRELSKITEYQLQQDDLQELSRLKERLSLLKKSICNTEYFESRQDTISEDIRATRDSLDEINDVIEELIKDISSKKSTKEELESLQTSIETKSNLETEYCELEKSYETVKRLSVEKKSLLTELDDYSFRQSKLDKEYSDIDFRLKSYKSLNKELSKYNEKYDEMELVRKSLSSKEGIPLLYINVYLKNIQEITNELLDIIYGGNLYLENFDITSDTFSIPFVTKGTHIKDVCYASQGEKSFISLSLSFALIYQSISRYNILLLDEIDSTLDTTNREKFIQIIEKQMDMTEAEQLFVISHNNMFNMYPVDVIDTMNRENRDNKLANYVKIKIS